MLLYIETLCSFVFLFCFLKAFLFSTKVLHEWIHWSQRYNWNKPNLPQKAFRESWLSYCRTQNLLFTCQCQTNKQTIDFLLDTLKKLTKVKVKVFLGRRNVGGATPSSGKHFKYIRLNNTHVVSKQNPRWLNNWNTASLVSSFQFVFGRF